MTIHCLHFNRCCITKGLSPESYATLDWLMSNHMVLNAKKFQTIVTTKRNLQNNLATPSMNNMTIKPKDCVGLLGVTIDTKLTFEKHTKKLRRSASCQLNAKFRLKIFFGFQLKKVLIESFVYSNFN